jgi:hypothetical protein
MSPQSTICKNGCAAALGPIYSGADAHAGRLLEIVDCRTRDSCFMTQLRRLPLLRIAISVLRDDAVLDLKNALELFIFSLIPKCEIVVWKTSPQNLNYGQRR